MRKINARVALVPLGVGALLATGCGSSQSAHGATTTLVPASTTSLAPTATAGSGPTTTASASATTVTATETEFHIALSQQSFTAGTYTFHAVNAGTTIHNLAITGPGLSGAITKSLSPGDKADLTVKLQKGTYDVFCAIDDHKGLGMNVNITVS